MEGNIVCKLSYGNELRRLTLPHSIRFFQFQKLIRDVFGIENPTLHYIDDEGDNVHLVSQDDWNVALTFGKDSKILRVNGLNYFITLT